MGKKFSSDFICFLSSIKRPAYQQDIVDVLCSGKGMLQTVRYRNKWISAEVHDFLKKKKKQLW